MRSVAFHDTQPIFICGGHDKNVYIYDYNDNRRVSTLEGHVDYVRSVTFHHELPLAMSGSDDQTIRIWNWQSKKTVVLLSGHRHYVMSVKFHKSKNLIVTSSLDLTIRLWDYSRMIEKMTTNKGVINPLDVDVVAVVEAHEKGTNWASFHPTQDLILSGGDDRRVKVWSYDESSMTEKETFFGHQFYVCCVEASPKTGHILSNSEDFTLKVWDDTGICIDTYTKAGEKQWMISCHQTLPYVAIGTDNSVVILSLDTTKFAHAILDENVFYIEKHDFKLRDVKSGAEKLLMEDISRPGSGALRSGRPKSILANPFNKAKWGFIVKYKQTKHSDAKLFYLEVDKRSLNTSKKQILATSCVFIGKNKIAFLNNGLIELSDTDTLLSLGSVKGVTGVDEIFSGRIGKLVYRKGSNIVYYDTVAKKPINTIDEFVLKKLRHVKWNKQGSCCALIAKKMIFLMNKNFKKIARVNEGSKIQASFWTKDGVLIYSTYNHLKYVLSNGDKGILKSLSDIRYPFAINKDKKVLCFDIDGNVSEEEVETEGFLFKKSIQTTNIAKVKNFIKNNNTPGKAMISFLCKKNYPSVALSLTDDEKTKFNLALRSGNLQAAYEAANKIKEKKCYEKLANEALKQGCNPLVEIGYQESENWQKLAFLHLVTGNRAGLKELSDHAAQNNDKMTQFNISVYNGDIQQRIKILSETGQLPLAYQMAKVHGRTDLAEAVRKAIPETAKKIKWSKKSTALLPPRPLVQDYETACEIMNGWPIFEVSEEKQAFMNLDSDEDEEEAQIGDGEVDDEDDEEAEEEEDDEEINLDAEAGADWNVDFGGSDLGSLDDDDDEDAEGGDGDDKAGAGGDDDILVFIQKDDPIEAYVNKNSLLAADYVSIGRFDLAIEKLKSQIGLKSDAQIKKSFLDIYMGSQMFTSTFDFIAPQPLYLTQKGKQNVPFVTNTLKSLEASLKNGYKLTTKAKFAEALNVFRDIMLKIPLLSVPNKSDISTAKKILDIAVEYFFALKCDQLKKKTVRIL